MTTSLTDCEKRAERINLRLEWLGIMARDDKNIFRRFTISVEERMQKWKLFLVLGAAMCLVIGTGTVPASAQQIDRTQLPIPDTQYKYPGKIPLDARDAKFPPIKLLRPPEGTPNVMVILLDDIGFGAPSTFGGGVNMPTLDALPKEGLRYTQFHTT